MPLAKCRTAVKKWRTALLRLLQLPGSLQADGKIVVAGYRDVINGNSDRHFITARFNPSSTVNIVDQSLSAGLEIYPNPLSENSVVRLKLKEAEEISLQLSDISGRLLYTLCDRQNLPAGQHLFELDDMAKQVAGCYVLTLKTEIRQESFLLIVK